MFSAAVSIGSRLKNWKMNPMWSRRSFVSAVSSRPPMSIPATDDLARGRLVQAGEDVHQRRLARARRTHDRGQPLAGDVEVDAPQRVDGRLALAVVARDVPRTHRDLGRRVAAIARRDGE